MALALTTTDRLSLMMILLLVLSLSSSSSSSSSWRLGVHARCSSAGLVTVGKVRARLSVISKMTEGTLMDTTAASKVGDATIHCHAGLVHVISTAVS